MGGLDYTAATLRCRSAGMNLYSVTNALDWTILKAFFPGGAMRIDGLQATNGTWYVYNPNPVPLYSLAIPGSGPCLAFAGGTFGIECSVACTYICEFV